jgi:hypothetical protein
VALAQDLERIALAAGAFAAPGETVAGIVAAEPAGAARVYLCAFEAGETTSWLALDDAAEPVASRRAVRDAVSLSALCEVAEEVAGGGDLPQLRARLAELRETEMPEGIEEGEQAAEALDAVLQPPPRLATPDYLDAIGAASRQLEQALGDEAGSPFASAMQQALPAVEELANAVVRAYKRPLD